MGLVVGRHAAGVTVGLAIVLSLTACKGTADKAPDGATPAGGGAHPLGAQDVLAKMSSRTKGITSFVGIFSLSAQIPDARIEMTGRLACRLKPARATRYDAFSMEVDGKKAQVYSEIRTGGRLYRRMPALSAMTGKPWTSIPIPKLDGADLSLDETSQGDPSLTATWFTASKDAREVGRETVGGVSTTHYQGTYDLGEGQAKLGGRQRAKPRKSFTKSGKFTVRFEVWVDGQQLPRKVITVTPLAADAYEKVTMTYTAFDVPVSVAAPPKSQVADGSGLIDGGAPPTPG